MGYVLVLAFISAALFAYISGSSFVFENLHGVSATTYSLIFASNAVAMLIAGAAFSQLAGRVRLNTLLVGAVVVAGVGALAQVLLVLTVGRPSPAPGSPCSSRPAASAWSSRRP